MPRVQVDEYDTFEGSKKTLIKQVGDGSIIKRFDRTPFPQKKEDIVCPHFLELKWALGCPFDCAWCYLKGSLRHYPRKKDFTPKPYSKIKSHLLFLFRTTYPDNKELLNAGELADSLAGEHLEQPFSKFIIPLFQRQRRFKLLLLTKSNQIENLLEMTPHNQVVVSFTLNALPVSRRWEKAPAVTKRIEAAKKVFNADYETRIRIDPIVPYPKETWKQNYQELVDQIFSNFQPERITLGSLRGLQSTINQAQDKSWVKYLKEQSKWGKRVSFEERKTHFEHILYYLNDGYNYTNISICKEPIEMWEALGLNWRECNCNCVL